MGYIKHISKNATTPYETPRFMHSSIMLPSAGKSAFLDHLHDKLLEEPLSSLQKKLSYYRSQHGISVYHYRVGLFPFSPHTKDRLGVLLTEHSEQVQSPIFRKHSLTQFMSSLSLLGTAELRPVNICSEGNSSGRPNQFCSKTVDGIG